MSKKIQTPESVLKMLSELYNQCNKNPRFSLIQFLELRDFKCTHYRPTLQNLVIVKNVGGKTSGQVWHWVAGKYPDREMAENFLNEFRTKLKGYTDKSREKKKTDEINILTHKSGDLFTPKKNEVLEVGKIQNAVYDHLAGTENEIGRKVVGRVENILKEHRKYETSEHCKPIEYVGKPPTQRRPPKIVEKDKKVYNYRLSISDGNLAFQFAFLWGLVKINFVYRGKGAQ